jgi:hypothetical protein
MVNDVAWIIKDNKASFGISALLQFQVLNSRYIFSFPGYEPFF